MKKLLMLALAVTVVAVPMAGAQAQYHHGPQQYPRGWGPHRGPDRVGYYHGYRGYRQFRPGYRRHNDGLWYPAAAFAIGAIIGGAMSH